MAETNSKKKAYLFEIHFLRAFACIAVVGVHVSATNYGMNDNTFTWYTYFLNQIGRFGTTTFAVISGFLLFYQLRKRGFQLGKFVKSRMAKVIIPFLLWSLIYRYLLYYYDHQTLGNLWDEAGKILRGDSFYHLYFVAIVAQFYIVFPLLQKIFRTQTLVLVFTVLSFLVSYHLYGFNPGIGGAFGEFLKSKSFMPLWLAYFSFGAFMAYYWEGLVTYVTKRPWQMLVLTLAILTAGVLEYNVNGYLSDRGLRNLIYIPLLCLSIIGIFPLLSKWNIIKKPLVLIGKYSMGIYLVHPLVLYLMARHLPQEYWSMNGVYVTLMFVAVTVICMAFIRLVQFIPMSTFFIPVPKVKQAKESKTIDPKETNKQKSA